MPHVLEDIQNNLSQVEYDQVIFDLATNFMTYVADPSAETKKENRTLCSSFFNHIHRLCLLNL